MTVLYGAKGSVVHLRSKNMVKLLPQSAEKRTCMGKLAFEKLAEMFLKNKKTLDVQIFQGLGLLPMRYLKKIQQESSARNKETIHILESKFSVFAKKAIIRPLTFIRSGRHIWRH